MILASICAAAAILIAVSKGSNLVELLFVFLIVGFWGFVLFVASAGGERESQEFFLSHHCGMNEVLLENSCSKHPPTHHLSIQEEEEIKNPRCWGKQASWPK